jgi:hypothetical protein
LPEQLHTTFQVLGNQFGSNNPDKLLRVFLQFDFAMDSIILHGILPYALQGTQTFPPRSDDTQSFSLCS